MTDLDKLQLEQLDIIAEAKKKQKQSFTLNDEDLARNIVGILMMQPLAIGVMLAAIREEDIETLKAAILKRNSN